MMSVEVEAELVLGRPTAAARALRFVIARGWRTAAKVLVSAGLLVWLFNKVQFSELSLVAAGDWRPLLSVWLLQSALPFVQAQRWRIIAATLGASLPYASAIKNVYIGQFFNQVLPSSVGGDAVRIWKSARFMPAATALSSIALDRVVALIAIPVILAVGSGMLLRIVPEGPFRWSLLAIIAAAIGALIVLLSADRFPLPRALRESRLVDFLLATPRAARRLFADPGCLTRALALSIVIHFGVGTSLWILARGVGVDAPIAAFLLLAPLVTLVTTLPISLGGWGVREGAMVTALSLIDVSPAIALSVSIQFGLIMMVVGLPGGLLAFLDPVHAPRSGEPQQAADPS